MDWSLKRIIQKTRLLTHTANVCESYYGNLEKRVYSGRTARIRHTIKKLGLIPYDHLEFLGKNAEEKNQTLNKLMQSLNDFHGFAFSQILSAIAILDTVNTLCTEYEFSKENNYYILDYPFNIEVHTRASIHKPAGVSVFTDIKKLFEAFLTSEIQPSKVCKIIATYGDSHYYLRLTAKASNFDYLFSEEAYNLKQFKRFQKDMSNPHFLNLFFWSALKGSKE